MDGVDFRCPAHPVRLLLRIGKPVVIDGANLIEVACRDCRTDYRKAGVDATLVLHRFNVLGELIETVVDSGVAGCSG